VSNNTKDHMLRVCAPRLNTSATAMRGHEPPMRARPRHGQRCERRMLTPHNNVTPRKKQDGGGRGTRCLSPWCRVDVERRVLPPPGGVG